MRKGSGQDFPSQPEVQSYSASVMLLKNLRRLHVALNRTRQNQIRVLVMARETEQRAEHGSWERRWRVTV